MQIAPAKKFLYSAILFAAMLLALEILLSAVSYHVNEKGFAVTAAMKEALRIASGRDRQELDYWIDMPPEVLQEVEDIGGVIDNVNNPTGATRENSPATEASELFGFKMRGDIEIANYMLHAKDVPNLSPPVLQYPAGREVPAALRAWLEDNASLYHSFSTDAEGRRRTLPAVTADDKIVLVGDSVAFGTGVADEHTVASAMQKRVAPQAQVVNLGVPSYGAEEAYLAATTSEFPNQGHVLVYLACQNDFHAKNGAGIKIFDQELLRETLAKFRQLEADGVYRQVVVVLETYLQFSFYRFFNEWEPERIASIREGHALFDSLTAELGLAAVNWDSLLRDYNRKQESLYAGVALYVDHVHLSPLGNRLMAEAILGQISLASGGPSALAE